MRLAARLAMTPVSTALVSVAVWASVLFGVGAGAGCAPAELGGCDGSTCPDGARCVQQPGGRSACAPSCEASDTCDGAAPVCDAAQKTCRACLPGEDAACRARSAATPRCVAGSCVACTSPKDGPAESPDCGGGSGAGSTTASTTPVCDSAQNRCRPCQLHGECASGVCAKEGSDALGLARGSCVPPASVMFVDQSLCSQAGPVFCTPQQAIDRIDSRRRFIVLRKRAFLADFSDLRIGTLPAQQGQPVYLIGPLADTVPLAATALPAVSLGDVDGKDALTVEASNVVLEGLYVRGAKTGVVCRGPGASVRIVRSVLSANDTAAVATGGCDLTIEQSWVGRGPAQSVFAGVSGNARGLEISASDFHIVGSVLCDNGDYRQDGFGGIRVNSLSAGSKRSTVVNSTFYQQSGLLKMGRYYTTMLCGAPVGDRIAVVNSLLFTDQALITAPEEHFFDPTCGVGIYRVASNDPLLAANQSVVLAMPSGDTPHLFKDVPGRDLRLTTHADAQAVATGGARAVDVGTDRITAPLVDLAGRTRGAVSESIAIGAFEPAP